MTLTQSQRARRKPASPVRGGRRAGSVRLAVAQAYLAFVAGGAFRAEPPPGLPGAEDRRLYVQLLRGMVRHKRLLETEVARLAGKPFAKLDVRLASLALMGLYQLRFLDLPPHAAVYETVELAPALGRGHGKSWVNGVLRSAQREGLKGDASSQALPLAVRTSHPDWLVTRWTERFGERRTQSLCEADNQFQGAALRVETRLISAEGLRERLAGEDITARPHPLLPGALWVEHLGSVLRSRAFEEGLCYIQDVGSQLLATWMAPVLKGRVLDACAAPGGKLTHLMALRGEALWSVGADRAQERLIRVRENAIRLQLPRPPLLVADGRKLPFASAGPERGWDAVLLDVPCSATGMIRKYPELKWRKHPEDLPPLARVQGELLAEAARIVHPGGVVAYSTCSLEREENEDVVEAFLAGRTDFRRLSFRDLEPPQGLEAPVDSLLNGPGDLFLLPGPQQMGLYAALLRKA